MRFAATIVTIAVASLALVSQAEALDLTGTWEGTLQCKAYTHSVGKDVIAKTPITVEITQSGLSLNMRVIEMSAYWRGFVMEDPDKTEKGMASTVLCGTSDSLGPGTNEIASGKAKADSGKGKLKLQSVMALNGLSVATCKYVLKRVLALDPEVSDCP